MMTRIANVLEVVTPLIATWVFGITSVWTLSLYIMFGLSFSLHCYLVWRDAFLFCYEINNIFGFMYICVELYLNGSISSSWIILFRLLTYKWRKSADVIILGEQKCATTTLAHYLRCVFDMEAPFHYWNETDDGNTLESIVSDKESEYFRGIYDSYINPKYYPMCFGLKNFYFIQVLRNFINCITKNNQSRTNTYTNKLCFDACPNYLFLPFARDRICEFQNKFSNKRMKFLIVVRDPIDRSISNCKAELTYQMERELDYDINIFGFWRVTAFKRKFLPQTMMDMINYCQNDQFIQNWQSLKKIKTNEKIPDYYPLIERFGMIQKGMYHETIKWYFEQPLFRENTLIIDFKQLTESQSSTKKTLRKVASFLELDLSAIDWNKINVSIHRNKNITPAMIEKKYPNWLSIESKDRLSRIFSKNYLEALHDEINGSIE